jgi:16S rRNA (cytosine967-C5)-methyltransferase
VPQLPRPRSLSFRPYGSRGLLIQIERSSWIKPATAARRAALEILREVHAGAPLDAARDRHLTGLAERDRRLAYELSAGVLRHKRELDEALDLGRADPRIHDVLRLGAYQLRHLNRVPAHAAVSTSVELARETVGEGATGYVNHALRKLSGAASRERAAGKTHPDWLIAKWQEHFGADETNTLLTWNDQRPVLVVQPARLNLEQLAQAFAAADIQTRRAPFDAGLEVQAAPGSPLPALRDLPGYATGAFIVQDPAHALVARFAAIPPGEQAYDACAAPGGKAVALEAAGARIIAGDAKHDRLPRLADTTRRAGVAIRCLAADLEAAPIRSGSVDAVLVDAPCSATGTIRRHPDARQRLHPAVFARSAQHQTRLLEAAASLVRPGGLLIYATCSLEPEENEQVVERFLKQHLEFARSRGDSSIPAELLTPAGDFQSLPQRHGIDGAYAARLVRAS